MTMSSKRAGRPIVKRAKTTLLRDIQHIANLRTAILIDETIPKELANKISERIESLNEVLFDLLRRRD